MKIIALTGPKGSGKDTVGMLIKDMYPHLNPSTIAFADPIKKTINHIFNLSDQSDYTYDRLKRATLKLKDEEEHYSIEGRRLVREIGMLMRSYDEKQFTNYVVEQIQSKPDNLWVVTDLRFDNEYIVLKNLGAKVVKILRPSYNYDGHITERGFDNHLVDSMLMNDSDLEYLKIRINYVMKDVLEGTV